MNATQILYHDIPLQWHLSPIAAATNDCVPLSLCEALGTELEATKKRLRELAAAPEEGFRRHEVLSFLEEHAARGGKACGWKVFWAGGHHTQRKTGRTRRPIFVFHAKD